MRGLEPLQTRLIIGAIGLIICLILCLILILIKQYNEYMSRKEQEQLDIINDIELDRLRPKDQQKYNFDNMTNEEMRELRKRIGL